jgi:hypothetical protein
METNAQTQHSIDYGFRRRLTRNLAIGAFVLVMIPLLPLLINAMLDTLADSEVGIMMYALQAHILIMTPVIVLLIAIWTVFFVQCRNRKLTVPPWEPWLWEGIVVPCLFMSALTSWTFFGMLRRQPRAVFS